MSSQFMHLGFIWAALHFRLTWLMCFNTKNNEQLGIESKGEKGGKEGRKKRKKEKIESKGGRRRKEFGVIQFLITDINICP